MKRGSVGRTGRAIRTTIVAEKILILVAAVAALGSVPFAVAWVARVTQPRQG